MESILRRELGSKSVKQHGSGGGGCISSGQGYETDNYGIIFVKSNKKEGAKTMFSGEMASLQALSATNTVRVPKPIKVIVLPHSGSALVTEYLDIRGLNKYSARLGEDLARLHLHNQDLLTKREKQNSSVHHDDEIPCVEEFGFDVPTCCGFIPQENSWEKDWVTFYTRHKLQLQLDMVEKEYGDREARDLWPQLLRKIPSLFSDVEVVPALVHGDLWGGNAGEISDVPVIFDPASFYGHSEYDLGIAKMFGGFGSGFFSAYHKIIPKAKGFDLRNELYQLFHYLNHWNHFGGGYRGQSLAIMKRLAKL